MKALKVSLFCPFLPALLILLILLTGGSLFAENTMEPSWQADAEKAQEYFAARDYDAAWLFYRRALAGRADDGRLVLEAAESFSRQQVESNPELERRLYALAEHLLSVQYPDFPDSGRLKMAQAEEPDVNRRFIRKTVRMLGGRPSFQSYLPQIFGPGGQLENLRSFTALLGENVQRFFSLLRREGLRTALANMQGHWRQIMIFAAVWFGFFGILLPTVLALVAARDGRKCYVTAYLFLIHWGPLGIHRFYLGRHVSGIVWLLTFGLLGFGVFFDLFLAAAHTRSWNRRVRNNAASRKEVETRTVSAVDTPPLYEGMEELYADIPLEGFSPETAAERDSGLEWAPTPEPEAEPEAKPDSTPESAAEQEFLAPEVPQMADDEFDMPDFSDEPELSNIPRELLEDFPEDDFAEKDQDLVLEMDLEEPEEPKVS